jgi:DNA repair protein RadC
MRRALELSASALILVHNHPSRPRIIPDNHAQYH